MSVPPLRDVETVEQRYHCRTEQIIAQEVGGQIHQDGRIDIPEPNPEKEMYRIIGGEQQQCQAHHAPGA